MRWLVSLGLVAMVGVAGAVAAEMRASKPEVRREVIAVIDAQLEAFRQGDQARAYRYAAKELRAQKPLAVFVEIVRTSYPEIWSSRRSEAGIVRDDGGRATVTVQVYAESGDASYDYSLVRETAGWRIHGVLRHSPKRPRT